jgi:hypothetical protein
MGIIRIDNNVVVADSGTTILAPTKEQFVDIYQQLSAGLCSSDQDIKDGLKIASMRFSRVDTNAVVSFMTQRDNWEGSRNSGLVDLKAGTCGWSRKFTFFNGVFEVDFKNFPSQGFAWDILTLLIKSTGDMLVCDEITYVVNEHEEWLQNFDDELAPIPVDQDFINAFKPVEEK